LQLKSTQLEWAHNWKKLNDYTPSSLSGSPPEEFKDHPSRHQRLLKKHIIDLEKIAKRLNKRNDDLEAKIIKLEEQVKTSTTLKPTPEDSPDVIYGNEIEEYLQMNKLNPVDGRGNANWFQLHEKIQELESFQKSNADSIQNLSKQLSNFDKLHMSMLELLENVENIENKIDRSFPEFRKEISKLEFQMSDAFSQVALLKEDQTNTRDSVKAISVTVSYLKDKREGDLVLLQDVQDQIKNLKKSNTVQNSKLHDHIFKVESSTLDMNSTKSTIHLVEELKSFEKEYKSIVNKLPHDCSAVSGPNGVYLISPGDGEPIMAYCKKGWTTIQKRYDGSVDFNRKWNEYSNGFGSATGEHWLGNRNIHYLTKDNCSTLEINMKDIYGKYWQATYDTFWVGDYTVGFKMLVGNYKGNASDAMDYQNRMEFSTIDNDRDISNTHCASNYEGGWWFSHCQHANLNGRYNLGLTWFDSSRNEWIAVATSEMRLKRRPNCS
ncbi:protein scabrous-like, partial [Agrilus planipennis]|uniref:Protein scabrous-like n=1 Tax=Agrilus planipennis TaxID=224129 RepID=A0A7F5RIF7_AGRPL